MKMGTMGTNPRRTSGGRGGPKRSRPVSYHIGASPSQVDAQQKADAAKAALLKQFERFAFVVTTGASEIASGSLMQAGNPTLARAMTDSVPRLRRGVDNVLAGKTSPEAWAKSVDGLIAQVRAEAPSFSATSLISAGESAVKAAKIAAQAAADLVVATAATGGKAVKAAAEGAGIDLQKNIDQAASTTKYLAVAGVVLGTAYLLAPVVKVWASGKGRQAGKQQAG